MNTKRNNRLALSFMLELIIIVAVACTGAPASAVAPAGSGSTSGKPAVAATAALAGDAAGKVTAAPAGGTGSETHPAPAGSPAGEMATIHPGIAYIDDVDYLHIYAEVENHTDQWLSGWVTVKLFDKDGK